MSSETAETKVPRPRPELAETPAVPDGPRPVGRIRVPLGLHYMPWVTLYRFPDGRLEWCLHLWQVDRPVPTVVATRTLLRYARDNRLEALRAEIEGLLARAMEGASDVPA
jgi:hypothetical protein